MRLTILFLFLCSSVVGQEAAELNTQPTIANLSGFMELDEVSEDLMDSLITLTENYGVLNLDTGLLLTKKCIALSETMDNKSYKARSLIMQGSLLGEAGDRTKGLESIEAAYQFAEQNDLKNEMAEAANKKGYILIDQGQNEAAQEQILEAISIWTALGDDRSMFQPYLNLGWIHYNMQRLDKAWEYIQKAAELAEKLDDDKARMYVKGNAAIILMKRAELFEIAAADSSTTDPEGAKDSSDHYVELTLQTYQASIDLAEKLGDKSNVLSALNNMVALKVNIGDFDSALELSRRAEAIAVELGAMWAIIQIKYNMAGAYLYMGKPEEAVPLAKESLELAQKHDMLRKQALSNKILHEAYKALGDHENALAHYEAYEQYIHETTDVERNKALAEIEAKYETAENERKILAQENDILALETANIKVERQRNYSILGLFVLLILGYFGYQNYKAKKERDEKKAFADALILAQESERKRISRDLHDGVGQSLLLIKKQLAKSGDSAESAELVGNTLEEVRAISRDLHPYQLEKFGLTTALKEMIENVGRSTGLFITHELDQAADAMSSDNQIHFYRTIQEALNNVIKHSQASAAKVTVQKTGQRYVASVRDNGKGMGQVDLSKSKSLGLKTMAERIYSIGGQIQVEANEPNGTVIKLSIPTT